MYINMKKTYNRSNRQNNMKTKTGLFILKLIFFVFSVRACGYRRSCLNTMKSRSLSLTVNT